MPSGNLNRILRYFEAVDDEGGSAPRMAFYRIAGNEDNLRRWEEKLCGEWRLMVRVEEGDRIYYRKTEAGENLHQLLKIHGYVGSLFEELIRDRLKPDGW